MNCALSEATLFHCVTYRLARLMAPSWAVRLACTAMAQHHFLMASLENAPTGSNEFLACNRVILR
jgi:hypothetical protein